MAATYTIDRGARASELRYHLRIVRVLAAVGFKVKYVDSALGYVWSLAKPLAYFAVLWLVFGGVFETGIEDFALYLIVGLVLYMFFVDAISIALASVVAQSAIIRRIAFPPLIVPVSATVTSAMTFAVNLVAVAVFLAASRATPRLEWLLVPALVAELYLFVLGAAMLASTLFVRLRDVGAIWEVLAQLLIFAAPVMYPLTVLPEWLRAVALANPLVQVIQDVRRLLLGPAEEIATVADVYGGAWGYAIPLGVVALTCAGGWLLFRRESPRFAERA